MIKYTKELLQEAVDNSISYAGVLRHLKMSAAGYNQGHIKKRILFYKINTDHFTGQGWNKGKTRENLKRTKEDILKILPEGSLRERALFLKRAMLESGIEYRCSQCPIIDEWNGKKLTLEIDHIDGNWLHNLLPNLRFLCPNCHSQTSTSKPHKNKLP